MAGCSLHDVMRGAAGHDASHASVRRVQEGMMGTLLRRHRGGTVAGFLATLLLGILVTGARAEVIIEGTPAALLVTTTKDAISDVMSALASTFNVRYRTSIRLDAAAGSKYSGSLGEVIGRLLDGYSYVIRKDQDVFEVVVVGSNGTRPIPVQAQPPREKNITSRWR
jgi:hypothetical protein